MRCVNPTVHILNDSLINNCFYDDQFINFDDFIDQLNAKCSVSVDKLISRRDIILYPCKKCAYCLSDKRHNWVRKMKLESECWKYAFMITLTYDNDHITPNYSLDRQHSRNFIKYLRKLLKFPIRFFLAGEYGSRTQRPHYHVIIFCDHKIPDLKLFSNSKKGHALYTSKLISKAWLDRGFISVAFDDSNKTLAYVASYVSKKNSLTTYNQYLSKYKYLYKYIDQDFKNGSISGLQAYLKKDQIFYKLLDQQKKIPEYFQFSRCPPLGALNKNALADPKLLTSCLLNRSIRLHYRNYQNYWDLLDDVSDIELLPFSLPVKYWLPFEENMNILNTLRDQKTLRFDSYANDVYTQNFINKIYTNKLNIKSYENIRKTKRNLL